MSDWNVCKLCVIRKGLRGIDLAAGTCPYAFRTNKELIKHYFDEHNIKVVE